MEKRFVLLVAVISIALLLISTPIVSAQTYSGFEKLTDGVKLFFSKGDNKAKFALEIREKEVDSAISNLESGNTEKASKNLNSASEKLEIVQTLASPDISAEVKNNIEEVEKKINENNADYELLNQYLGEEEKTKLSMDISEKVLSYCDELAMQNYESMQENEKCRSYAWMENKIKQRLAEEQEKANTEIETQIQTCMNNPKECNCEGVKLLSEKTKCEEYKSLAIKCEFQNDNSACEEVKMFKPEETEREKYEKQIMEKYLPAECSEAGVRDGEECKKLILSLNQPKSECLEEGAYVGDEKCKEKLVKEGNVPNECVVDGKLVDPTECLKNVKEENKPTGKEWELMSGECKERGVYDVIACKEMENLPRPCKDAGYYTKKECGALTLENNLPKECVDEGLLTPEACEKFKLPSDCQGAFSREECETIKIELKFPDECKSAGELDPAKCAFIMVGENMVPTGAEMEYLVKQGLAIEDIPAVCTSGTDVKTFIRSDDCDVELAKLGIILPKPTATAGIAKECMVDERTTVSPEECKNKIEKKLIIDTIPKECREAEVTNPEDCSKLLEQQRQEQGIGINMPEECFEKSAEECKKIMEAKGIKVEKIENEGGTIPEECIKMGVSDVTDCGMIAGKINEERIKNGEKVVIDENGKVDYVHPEQIEKMIEDSEKKSQDIKPDFERADGIKQEINTIEKSIQEIEKKEIGGDSSNVIDKPSMDKENEGVTPASNVVNNDANSESGGIVQGDSNSNSDEVSSGGSDSEGGSETGGTDSGGGGNEITGEVILSGKEESFLGKIAKGIFGI